MAEAVEGVIGGDQACGDGDKKGREGDKVIADAAPDEEAEEDKEEGEEADLIGGQGEVFSGDDAGGLGGGEVGDAVEGFSDVRMVRWEGGAEDF